MPIKVEDVEIAVREMLEEDLLINPVEICEYMGIDPIIVFPRSPEGKWVSPIKNENTIYNLLHTLREIHVKWRKRRRDAYESFREGYQNASYWDRDKKKMVYYKDIMSYKEFIAMRVPEEGIYLIPKPANSGAYFIPNPEEEKQWRKKHILGGMKTIKTRIKDGMKAGIIEDTRKVRKFIKGFDPDKHLIYKEEVEEEQENQ